MNGNATGCRVSPCLCQQRHVELERQKICLYARRVYVSRESKEREKNDLVGMEKGYHLYHKPITTTTHTARIAEGVSSLLSTTALGSIVAS